MTETIEARVARGAALLDEVRPGWVDRIDLNTLDLGACERCIVAQTTGECYWDGKLILGELSRADTIAHGFNAGLSAPDEDEFYNLTAEWTRVILARRGEAS